MKTTRAIPNATGPVIGQVGTRETINADAIMKRSPDSQYMLPYWDLTDTLIDGLEALKLAGKEYLPRFVDELDKSYEFRLDNAKYTNVYRDIVEGLASKPFEEEIKFVGDTPASFTDFAEDVDGAGSNLTAFGSLAFFHGINSAVHWIFVDYAKSKGNIVTRQDAKEAGIRPYWSHVLGRNVLDADAEVINGKETLIYIKIYEPGTPDRVREFTRAENGAVTWKLYEKKNNTTGVSEFVEIEDGTVSIGVIPLVPFATGRRDGRSFRFAPAMRDAADLSRILYRQESGLEFAKVLAAYPMLAANGISPPRDENGKPMKLAVGPGTVLYGGRDGQGNAGTWSYVEPSGSSLTFLAGDVKTTKEDIRELGRQPLTAQSGNLTVVTAATAAGKSKSAVKSWALGLKNAIEEAFLITGKFINETYEPQVNVFTEFDEIRDDGDLADLNTMREKGDLSQETLWDEKQRRGVLSPEFTKDNERKRLLDETPGDGPDTSEEI